MRFGQHRYQRMMRGPSMLARVRPAQRPLLPAIALEHGGVQIQTISRRTFRQPLQLPVPQAGEKTLALSLAETFEQVANGVVDRKASDPQQFVQGHVRTQQTGVGFSESGPTRKATCRGDRLSGDESTS